MNEQKEEAQALDTNRGDSSERTDRADGELQKESSGTCTPELELFGIGSGDCLPGPSLGL